MNAIQSTTQPVSFFALQADKLKTYSLSSRICLYLSRRAKVRFGAINTTKQAVYLPVRKVFSCPEFKVLDVGRAYPQGWLHNLFCVDIPHVHSAGLSNRRMVLSVQQGTKTMTNVNTPTTPSTGITSTLARQQAIENALSMALFHIRHGDTQQGIRAATAKAIRAASLLKQACTEFSINGRA